ncbi:hypothetical protein Enr13x_77870 [Stieleria neptunia]|uniref:Uncharacterized protein n=1 Tax=Stieleria neptunia TaxID=2527979 RepID=A0A518I444_9BACT|nr:hypothetical protein [Stieleria neptunia]QDV47875.1 hypothetical protein Enr13x_77870 [Stieleria neptunia]
MTQSPPFRTDDDSELSLETLDQWETELDQFAAGIMKRLSEASGKTIDVSGLIPPSQQASARQAARPQAARPQIAGPPTDPVDTDDESEAMQLLKSLREMTQ